MTSSSSTSAIVSEGRAFARLAIVCLACGGAVHAASNTPITRVLDGVGRQIESFWNYLPAVTCTEMLTQAKLGDKGKVLFEQRSSYDYLVLLQSAGGDVSVDESRVEKNHKDSKAKASFLQTNGFAILALIFHPLYQGRYEFTQLPDDTEGGRRMLRIAFRQVAEDQSPSVLVLRNREYPLQWKGTAWVDPGSYAVARIHAGLENSLEDVGLMGMDADVTYAPVPFSRSTTYWLPARAVIEASTRRQHWRNTHAFSDYRRFDVETETKAVAPR